MTKETIRQTHFSSPFGELILTRSEHGDLLRVSFLDSVIPSIPLETVFQPALEAFFGEREPLPHIDLSPLVGSEFQHLVWRTLQTIPPGETCTYREIAERIGAPRAVRSVGSACARNPLALFVPCHRVVHSPPRSAAKYAWGSERKNALLAHEQAIL